MVLRVSGKNLDIGTALREHVETRVAALAERYVTGLISGTVTFGPDGPGYRTDCNLRLTSGMSLQAEARGLPVRASSIRPISAARLRPSCAAIVSSTAQNCGSNAIESSEQNGYTAFFTLPVAQSRPRSGPA